MTFLVTESEGEKKQDVPGWLLMASILLQGIGQVALVVSLPLLVEATGISYSVLTAALSAGMAMVFFSAPYWGARSDRIGRLRVIQLGLLAMLVSHALLIIVVLLMREQAVSVGVLLLFASRIFHGLFVGGLYPSVQALLLDSSSSDQQAKALSRASAAINAGRLFGPLAGLIAVYFGVLPLLLILSMSSAMLLVTVSARCSTQADYSKTNPSDEQPVSQENSDELLWKMWQRVWPVFIVAVIVTSIFGILQFVLGPLLQERLTLSAEATASYLSLLMTAMAMVTLMMHLICGRLIKTRYLLFLRSGAVVLLSGCLLLCAAQQLWMVVCGLALAAASVAMMTPAYTALAAESAVSSRGRLTGMLSMMHSGGYALGGLIAGTAIALGMDYVFIWVVALSLILFLLVALVLDQSSKAQSQLTTIQRQE